MIYLIYWICLSPHREWDYLVSLYPPSLPQVVRCWVIRYSLASKIVLVVSYFRTASLVRQNMKKYVVHLSLPFPFCFFDKWKKCLVFVLQNTVVALCIFNIFWHFFIASLISIIRQDALWYIITLWQSHLSISDFFTGPKQSACTLGNQITLGNWWSFLSFPLHNWKFQTGTKAIHLMISICLDKISLR